MAKKYLKASALGAVAVSLGVTSFTAAVSTPPALAQEIQRDGTIKIITRYRTMNPRSWDFHHWVWKTSFDGLHTTQLMAGDLDKGPVSGGSNKFIAPGWQPPEDTKGEIAESWEVKKDPLRIEFKIRPGVMWMDKPGVMKAREVVASDIVYHFTLMRNQEKYIPTYWDFVREWKEEGKYKATAYLDSYNGNWPYRFGWGYFSPIVPPEWHKLSDEKRADWRNATGAGPYMVTDVKKSSKVTYTRNDNYFDKQMINGVEHQLPLNKSVEYMFIKDEATAIATIRTGKADVMEVIRWQFVDELKKSVPDLVIKGDMSPSFQLLALRNDKKPFNDIRVRRAMNMAINQQEIMDALINGQGQVFNFPMSAGWSSVYTPLEKLSPQAQDLFGYHPDKAKKLLAEAGYPNGFEFEMQYSTADPYHSDMVPMLQAYLEVVGVKLIAKPMEAAAFRSQMRKDTQALGYMRSVADNNPFTALRAYLKTGQTWNFALHSDEKFDNMWDEALAETDQAKQDQMVAEMGRYIVEERVPYVWLPTPFQYRAWWPWVKNYHGEQSVGAIRPGPIYARMWIDEKMKKEMGPLGNPALRPGAGCRDFSTAGARFFFSLDPFPMVPEAALPPLLEVNNLQTHFFGEGGTVKAVDGVSFHVDPGETLAIVGESGSGKSITAMSILRLIPNPPGEIVAGEIKFEGENVLEMDDERIRDLRGNKIAMIFQEPMTSLNPVLTVGRQIAEPIELHRETALEKALGMAKELLDKVRIAESDKRISSYPHQFSGGMRQRVMIAMGMACEPKLIIADEPTTALDVTVQAQLLELLKELTREGHSSLILITHDLGVVARYADRINVMYAGRIVESGTALEIFENPKHPYTIGLMNSIPKLDQDTKEKLIPIKGAPPDLANVPPGCAFCPRCEYAIEKCGIETPRLEAVGDNHWKACWIDVEH